MQILEDSKALTIFIPFMYKESRVKLFEACLKNVYELTKDDDEVEIVVHEVGEESTINKDLIEECEVIYGFKQWDESYHKAWSINQALKYHSSGKMFVMLDADIIVDYCWVKKMKNLDRPSLAWSRTININKEATDRYLETGFIDIHGSSNRLPGMDWHAGISVACPRQLMIEVKGVPEDFRGTWGGEDNSFLWKLHKLGHYDDKPLVQHTVYHMDHEATTPLHPEYLSYVKHRLKDLDKEGWENHLAEIGPDWGCPKLNDTEFDIDSLMEDIVVVCYNQNANIDALVKCLSESMPVLFPFVEQDPEEELSEFLPFKWVKAQSKFNYIKDVMRHAFGNPIAIMVASQGVGTVFMNLVTEVETLKPILIGDTIFNKHHEQHVIPESLEGGDLYLELIDREIIK